MHDLELAARRVVDGFMFGVHPSRVPGAGLEFSQYRSYQPGDDPRRVDWRLFARSDRYFVREADTETSVTVQLVLDASGSMAQAEGGVSKLDAARFLAAALAVLALRQGDAVGLTLLNGDGPVVVPPQRGHRHLQRLLHHLQAAAPGGVWPGWARLEGLFTAGGRRGVTLLLTDLAERADEIRTVALKLAALRHDVAVLHLVARAELEFPWRGAVTFEELETGRRIQVDADAARPAYLAALQRAQRTLAQELADRRVDYVRFALDQPLDDALRHYLEGRARAAAAPTP